MTNNLTLGAFTVIRNADKFDIPIIESIESIIDVVDQYVIVECYSEDNTFEICQQLQKKYSKKIKLVRRSWITHFTELSGVFNFAKDFLETDVVYELQADEVIHENSLDELRLLPERLLQENKTAARVHFKHFLGSPSVLFPFCYETLVRCAKQNTPWQTVGDAVQLAYQNSYIPENKVINTNIQVFHYGKMKSPEKGFQKESSFMEYFRDLGFPDPKVLEMKQKIGEKCDYLYLFRDHVVNKTIKKFDGTHPKVMEKRIAEFKASGYEQFVSMMEENLKIEDSSSNPLEQTLKRKIMD